MTFAAAKTHRHYALPVEPRRSQADVAVSIAETMDQAAPAWRELTGHDGFSTAYQDFDLCSLWLEHVGRAAGFAPFVVIGRDPDGRPLFVWPLVRRSVSGCQVASFFCGRHANFGTTLWRSDVASAITLSDLDGILDQMAALGIDALSLHNQPREVHGLANPLLLLPHQDAPDRSYSVTLESTGEATIARQYSSDTRRKLRRKERHLAQLPGYRYVRIAIPAQADQCVTEFLKQKAARLAARGIANAFDETGIEAFLKAACRFGLSDNRPLIELHAIGTDTETLALFAGIHDRRCFYTMFNSYTLGEHARMSPGLILLLKLVDDCARRGFQKLNLGVGAAEYKSALCDDVELPFDSLIGLTARGRLFAAATGAVRTVKSAVKNNPQLWDLVMKSRAALFSRS